MKKRFSIGKIFAGVLLAASIIAGSLQTAHMPAVVVSAAENNDFTVGSKVTCAGYTGTITGVVTKDNDNFYDESGSLVFDSINEDGDVVFITDDNGGNIRCRCYIGGRQGRYR